MNLEATRIDMLYALALASDVVPSIRFVPLSEGQHEDGPSWDDTFLAAKEAHAMGHLEICHNEDYGPMVRITAAGYDYAKAQKLLQEV